MTKILIDFEKCYAEQTKEVKEKLCRHDFYEIKNLLIFKKFKKKGIDKLQFLIYNIDIK